jgi:hypothetical protein
MWVFLCAVIHSYEVRSSHGESVVLRIVWGREWAG